MNRFVRLAVVCLAALSCTGTPSSESASNRQPLSLGPVQGLGGAPILAPSVFLFPRTSRSASSPSLTLVVWSDRLTGTSSSTARIRGARIDASGTVLDPTGITIGPLAQIEQFAPAVAWNGTNFVVVWNGRGGLFATAVTPAGQLVSPTPTQLTVASGAVPEVACTMTDCLAAWNEATDVFGARLDLSGALVGAPFAINTAIGTQANVQVAVSGANYFVTWFDSALRGSLVTGSAAATPILLPSGATADSDLAGTSDLLAVWAEGGNIRGARISAAGALLDPTGFTISSATGTQSSPRVSWSGTQWVVAWEDTRDTTEGRNLYGARVSTAAAVLDTTGVALARGANDQVSVATSWLSSTSGFISYFTEEPSAGANAFKLRGAPMSLATGLSFAGATRDLSRTANSQVSAGLAWNGSRYLAVWEDGRDGGGAILGARFFPDGGLQDTSPVVFGQGPYFNPKVVAAGSSFLVTWHGPGRIQSASLGSTGTASLGSNSFSTTVSDYDIAANGSSVLMVWTDYGSGGVGLRGSFGVGGLPFELRANGDPTVFSPDTPNVSPGPGTGFTVVWRVLGSGLRIARVGGGVDAGVLTSDLADVWGHPAALGSS